jgi:hypothetical protein
MEPPKPDPAIENDVLHLGSPTRLTPEEIAKAIAHHNRHHHDDNPRQAKAQPGGKKQKAPKGK